MHLNPFQAILDQVTPSVELSTLFLRVPLVCQLSTVPPYPPSHIITPGCRFQVNFSAFHSTFEVTTPTISAKQLEKIMGGYVPPESRQMAELNSHLSNGTCLSPCHSLPSTLNRRKSALSAGKLLNGEDDDSDSIQV